MRKINKLLKKLFNVQLVSVREYEHLLDTFELAKNKACSYTQYIIRRNFFAFHPCYEVIGANSSSAFIIVKRFFYEEGNPEDQDYAQLCAQELCDKLNEEL